MGLLHITGALEALRLIAELELALADFYQACAAEEGETQSLWQSLEQEERHHAENIHRMEDIIAARPAEFAPRRPFNTAAVQTFISYVRATAERVRSGELSRADSTHLLTLARDMEQSVLESKYSEILQTTDVEYQGLMRQIVAETVAHKGKIVARLSAAGTGRQP